MLLSPGHNSPSWRRRLSLTTGHVLSSDGSYYYSNPNGSVSTVPTPLLCVYCALLRWGLIHISNCSQTYHNDGAGGATYTPSGGSSGQNSGSSQSSGKGSSK